MDKREVLSSPDPCHSMVSWKMEPISQTFLVFFSHVCTIHAHAFPYSYVCMETRSGHKCLPQSRSTLLAKQDPSGVLLAVVELVDLASLSGWLTQ